MEPGTTCTDCREAGSSPTRSSAPARPTTDTPGRNSSASCWRAENRTACPPCWLNYVASTQPATDRKTAPLKGSHCWQWPGSWLSALACCHCQPERPAKPCWNYSTCGGLDGAKGQARTDRYSEALPTSSHGMGIAAFHPLMTRKAKPETGPGIGRTYPAEAACTCSTAPAWKKPPRALTCPVWCWRLIPLELSPSGTPASTKH